jgi:hypothetical protein
MSGCKRGKKKEGTVMGGINSTVGTVHTIRYCSIPERKTVHIGSDIVGLTG